MDWLQFLASVVGDVAWPATIAFCVWLFRAKLLELLPDLEFKHKETELSFRKKKQEATTAPVEELRLDLPPAQQTIDHEPAPSTLMPYSEPPRPTVAAVMETIDNQVKKYPEHLRHDILIREVASAQVLQNFESIYADIFDSQIEFLRSLSSRGVMSGVMSLEEVNEFYETWVKNRSPLFKDWTADTWLRYLIVNSLVRVEAGRVEITPTGHDFLAFVNLVKIGRKRGL